VAVLVAVCLIVLMTVLAMGLDGGLLQDERRHAQATADAAALAGAAELYRYYGTYGGQDTNGAARTAALNVAKLNGYDNDGQTSTVTVNLHGDNYSGGPKAGQPIPKGYIEVEVEYQMPRFFSNVIGSGKMPVKARAVARGTYEPGGDGVIVLDRSASKALNVQGNGTFYVKGDAKVIVNSKAPDGSTAAGYAGHNSIVDSEKGFSIRGGVNDSSRFTQNGNTATIEHHENPVPDPLRFLPTPTRPPDAPRYTDSVQTKTETVTTTSKVKVGGKWTTVTTTQTVEVKYVIRTYHPGAYPRGINETSGSGIDYIVFESGLYYFPPNSGGLKLTGQANVLAEEVMIYNDPRVNSDAIEITGQGTITWTPPSSGTYKGMSIFQNRDSPIGLSITGNGSSNMSGTFYAANAEMSITGNGSDVLGSQYISRLLNVNGNGRLTINYNASQPPGQRVIQLVE
jgi:hypothetical protein